MKKILLSTTAAILIGTGAVHAQTIADQVITQLQAQGYESIEIKNGPTQIKVEAVRDGRKLEVIYDARTGEILKQEVEAVAPDDTVIPGVSIEDEDEDFLDDEDDEDDEDDDEEDDEDEDEDDDDDDEDDDEDHDDEDDEDEDDEDEDDDDDDDE